MIITVSLSVIFSLFIATILVVMVEKAEPLAQAFIKCAGASHLQGRSVANAKSLYGLIPSKCVTKLCYTLSTLYGCLIEHAYVYGHTTLKAPVLV